MEGMEPAGWSQQLQQCQLWATGTALNLCCWVSDQGSPLGPIHHTARRNFLLTAHVNNLYTQLGFWKGRHSDMQLPCVTWGQGLQVPLAGLPEVFWFQPRCHAHNEIWWSCHSTVSWHAALFYWLQELPSSAHTLWDVATKALFFPKDLFFDCSSYKITVHKRKSTTLCTMCKSTQWRAQFCWTHLFFFIIQGSFPFLMTSLYTHLAASSRGLIPCSWNYILNCTWIVSPKSVSLEFARSSWKFPDKAFLRENSLKVLSSTFLLQPAILRDEQQPVGKILENSF